MNEGNEWIHEWMKEQEIRTNTWVLSSQLENVLNRFSLYEIWHYVSFTLECTEGMVFFVKHWLISVYVTSLVIYVSFCVRVLDRWGWSLTWVDAFCCILGAGGEVWTSTRETLAQCCFNARAIVADGVPALKQHWANVPRSLGCHK